MKRLWIWFQSLSRSRQIGVSVLAAHAVIVLMLSVNHISCRRQDPKRAIAIRTRLVPKMSAGKEQLPAATKPIAAAKISEIPSAKKGAAAPTKKGGIPVGPKKTISPEKGEEIDNRLLQQLAESLGAIAASPKVSEKTNFAVSLPPSIEIKTGTHAQFDSPGYGEMISAILQSNLDLPEFGEVVAKIEIEANGAVTQCEILETQSRKNAEFLKKRLQELAFPCFNGFGLSEKSLKFTITFRNVENR